MKLNNKGFALTSVIYMLIVLFLMTMLLILANLAQRKVVLDKIKSDVKQELNQGGVLAQNIYTVTFDPTIGQINQTSKQVTYNQPYGELPTPTREGYKFVGWTSKNIAPEIKSGNYTFTHFADRTTHELLTENGENYIRINGNSSATNIDTLWRINSKYKLVLYQGEYILSFDVRSQNSPQTQYLKKRTARQDGKTGIYINEPSNIDNMIANIENDYNFDNDGQWHHFTSKVTIPYDTHDALIVIGNDAPNLYGTNSYIDIKNIQLESGDTATSYEPYQEYTSDTIVTKQENHTLYAMWEPYYTVTLDANGGTLTQNTKQVLYNEPYGELSTPTREGYTFLGWNGSNLFDKNNNIEDTYIATDGTYTLSSAGSKTIKIPCKPNTTYYIQKEETTRLRYGFYNEEPKENVKATFVNEPSSKKEVSFTTENDTTYIAIFIINGPDTTPEKTDSVLNSVMINEGNKYLLYEPYYITPSTTVVQTNDHTLKAIWQANE